MGNVKNQMKMNKDPLNKLQQLMCITMEECGELTQACSKAMRKFNKIREVNDNNLDAIATRQKLIEEAGDVMCMIELMIEHKLLTTDELRARINIKTNKLKKWSNLVK